MKKAILFFTIIVCVCCNPAISNWQPADQKPAVFVLDAKTLAANRNRLKASSVPVRAYKELIKDAEEALKFGPVSVMEKKNIPPSGDKHDYMSLAPYHWPDPSKPDGLPYIRKDGQTNPEVKEYKDKEYLPLLCEHVSSLAQAWYFSGDKVYAEHAAKLLRVWFLDKATRMNPNLNFGQAMKGTNTGRGAGLIDSRHFIKLIDAMGLIEDSKYWTKDDREGMKKWFTEFLHWMQTSPIGMDELDAPNNHGAWYDAQRLAISLFVNDIDNARKIVASAQDRLDKQMDANGSFPKEMERTISLHYSVFVMEAFFNIALMAEDLGIDLWNYTSPSGKSLRKGFETLKPYLLNEKKWEGEQIKPFDIEEGYFVLVQAENHLGCKKCRSAVSQLAGEKAEQLRLNLIY